MSSADVIVVGAGIVGAACARALADSGCRVRVFDAGRPSATHAGMGHLVPIDDDPAEFALARHSMLEWRGWSESLPADCAYAGVGTLWVAADEGETAAARTKQARLAAAGIASEWLDAAALARAEPALARGLAGGLRVPGDAIVYAPRVAHWLTQAAGIELQRAEVTALEADGVFLRDGSRHAAAAVVLATGADASALCPELPVRPKKGHLVITDRYPGTVRHQLVELGYAARAHAHSGSSVAFNVQPRPTGQLLLGSSRQFDSADASVDPGVVARMLRRVLRYLPGLARLNAIRSWTGLRPATPDGLPLIGRHPDRERHPRLWLALGHEGLGVTTAPATAQLVAAALLGRASPFDGGPYRPERFA